MPPTEYDVCVVREIFDLLACRASEKRLKHVSCVIVVPSTTIPLESSSSPSRTVLMSTEVLNQKGRGSGHPPPLDAVVVKTQVTYIDRDREDYVD